MAEVKDCIHCHLCQKNCDFLTKYGIDIGDEEKLKELAYHCFLCGKCTEVCPIDIDGRAAILDMRRALAEEDRAGIEKTYKGTFSEKQNYKFRNWKHVTEGVVFFPGCNFPSLFPKTSAELSRIFAEHGIGTVYDCCGKPIAELGASDDEDRIIAEIKGRLEQNNIKEVVLACPNCRAHFGDRLGVKVTSVFAKLRELGIGKVIEENVKIYSPCPDREQKLWIEEMKPFIVGEIIFVEGVQCCGLGGQAAMLEPEIAAGFAEKFKSGNEGQVYAYCASCTGRIKRNGFGSIDHILTKVIGTNEKPCTSISYVNRVLTKFK